MYVVIVDFTDVQDNRHIYRIGDEFPRSGISVSEKRLKELSTANNRRGISLIRAKEPEIPVEKTADEQTTTPDVKRRRGRKKKAE